MKRTRVRRRRRAAILVGGALVVGVLTAPLAKALGEPNEPAPAVEERYVVRSGDTLWSIAGHVAPNGDPRPVVDALVEANDVDPGALVPGQTLVVPAIG
jgi:nucleoid-associated protein YgaU